MDVNAMLGLGGDVRYMGCESRIEGIIQCTKKYNTILRNLKKNVGGGGGAIFEPKILSMYFIKERRIEVLVKIPKNVSWAIRGARAGRGAGWVGGQCGCD